MKMPKTRLRHYKDLLVAENDKSAMLFAALERLLAAFSKARELAIKRPIAENEIVTELQTSGGAQFQAEDAIRLASKNTTTTNERTHGNNTERSRNQRRKIHTQGPS